MHTSTSQTSDLPKVEFWIEGEPGVLITVTETADHKLDFWVRVTDFIASTADKPDIADLRGLFFHVNREDLLPLLRIESSETGNITQFVTGANAITTIANDVTMSGAIVRRLGPFDVGIEIGTQGMGKDDNQEARFTLSALGQPLGLDFILGRDFGVRLTSVSVNGEGREASLKLAGKAVGTNPNNPPPNLPADSSYDDLIEGGDGNDTIHGGRGDDEIQGEGGDDLISGDTDNGALQWSGSELSVKIGDNLYSNDGSDTFLFKKGDGVDMIWDFTPGEDIVWLTNYKLSDAKAAFIGAVANWIPSESFPKITLLLDRDQDGTADDAVVFYDSSRITNPGEHQNKVAFRFADGTLTAAQLTALALASPVATGTPPAAAVRTFGTVDSVAIELAGGNGEDILIGAAGHDRLYGNEGRNGFNGWGGNDRLFGGNGVDIMLGDDGDDILYGNAGDDTLVGGSGSDKLYGTGGADMIFGDDAQGITLPSALTTFTPVTPGQEVSAANVTIKKTWWGGFEGEIVVTANASVANWSVFLRSSFNVVDIWGAEIAGEWSSESSSDPTSPGSIVYELDSASWNSALSVGHTARIGFTAVTGVEGYVTEAVLQAGLSIVGGPSVDALAAPAAMRTLGNTLRGYAGPDRLVGSEYSDTFYVDDAGDQVIEALSQGGKADEVKTSISYALAANVEKLSAADQSSANLKLTGNSLKNVITGSAGKNTIKGGNGNDILKGKFGNDSLAGGKGKDTFAFDMKLNKKKNVDMIVDFNVRDDKIWLDNAIFKKLGKKGSEKKPRMLKEDFFTIGDAAQDSNDYLVYDDDSGRLYYDADGSGRKSAIVFAKLKKYLDLSHKDFFTV